MNEKNAIFEEFQNKVKMIPKKHLSNFKVKTVIEKDKMQKYESDNFFQKILHRFWVLILMILPIKFAKNIFFGLSKDASKVGKHATTHVALEVLYNFNRPVVFRNGFLDGIFTFIWHHLYSVRSTRNRLRLVKKIVRKRINKLSNHQKVINILSLGSGSARAILEVMADFNDKDLVIRLLGVDKSNTALDYCKNLASEFGIKNENIILVEDKVTNIQKILETNNYSPDIIEAVGIFDYFTNEKMIALIGKINILSKNGSLLVGCNIRHNFEESFLTKIVDWPMIYKDEEDISEIITESNYSSNNSIIILEPLKMHMIFVVQKF